MKVLLSLYSCQHLFLFSDKICSSMDEKEMLLTVLDLVLFPNNYVKHFVIYTMSTCISSLF